MGKSAHPYLGIKKAPCVGRLAMVGLVELGLWWALSDGGGGLGDGHTVRFCCNAGVGPCGSELKNGFLYFITEVSSCVPESLLPLQQLALLLARENTHPV